MTLVLDAGAFIAIERSDRDIMALLKREHRAGRPPVTHGGVVGQVWRSGGGRQANLARLLPGVDVQAIDEATGKEAGVLLARAGGDDVIDATVALLAVDGDEILTSDPADLRPLAVAAGLHVDIVPV
ncbi:MAG: twitching motility protein PilT [Actinomycetota bacterium]